GGGRLDRRVVRRGHGARGADRRRLRLPAALFHREHGRRGNQGITMPSVTFDHVCKQFGDTCVVEDFDLTVADGELLVLVGGSGSGKSTILRMLAGLESVTSGAIRIDTRDVTALPARERDVAMVFQDSALYPHMTVRENLSLGLRLRKVPRPEIDRRVGWAGSIL